MEEAVIGKNQEETNSTEFQQLLEMVRDMMGELHQEASLSVELNELNISNEWADGIKALVNSPLKSSFEALQSLEESILGMINEKFVKHLDSNKELIDELYRVSNKRLHYAIVLKEDTIDNEAEILEFKMNYDETPISRKFPLLITFPDKEHLKDANLAQKLEIG